MPERFHQKYKTNNQKRNKVIFYIVVILLILAVGYIVYDEMLESQTLRTQQAFLNGFQQGQLQTLNDITAQIQQGNIPIDFSIVQNRTRINWKTLNELCGELKNKILKEIEG